MNIFFNSRIYANQSLLNVLFGQQQKATISRSNGCIGTRDTLTISASGKEKLTKSTSGRTHNTSIDSSIDLKSYIASAKKTNQEIIENAGTQIMFLPVSQPVTSFHASRKKLIAKIMFTIQPPRAFVFGIKRPPLA